MKILITTGIYPPKVGGPAQYAQNLADEFCKKGYSVRISTYSFENNFPTGIRHITFFLKTLFKLIGANFVITLDTFSAGVPTAIACLILRKKLVLRTGGDFLWEQYVERTNHMIPLSEFYKNHQEFTFKEKTIYFFTKFLLKSSNNIIFSTQWQKDIFKDAYGIADSKTSIIENFFGGKIESHESKRKNFLWYVRDIKIKNGDVLKKTFEKARVEKKEIELDTGNTTHEELIRKIRECYVVILPSLSDISPNYILDAIRFNKPFILTKHSGYTQKFKEIGVFVDPLDENDMKDKILYLAEDLNYEKHKNLIKNYNFTHSWNEIADEFLKIFTEL